MKFSIPALFGCDSYKLDHRRQYPEGITHVYSNWTPRSSYMPGVEKVVFFGLQAVLQQMNEAFDEFFASDVDAVCEEYETNVTEIVGPNDIGSDHIRALHELGYVPLVFKALPEGALVDLKVPMFTVENTHPDFFWLVNYLETYLSSHLWMPCTSATQAHHMRQMLDSWAVKTTGSTDGVEFQGHDFSYRGHAGTEAAAMSGAGHLLSFLGSDSLPAKHYVQKYYAAVEPTALSVAATEHSVMSAGGRETEAETYSRLLDLYPSGIVSVVSDTYDLWNVITEILPSLKEKIMSRDGRLVVRPDSGSPADIICGLNTADGATGQSARGRIDFSSHEPEDLGVIELLWEIFGGTINDLGYKVLDPHIGAIYGDSITYDVANDICKRLEEKGFASTNVVLGLGSFFYQGGWRNNDGSVGWITRDTFGFAMKATNVTINGDDVAIFKDPKTDKGTKKSAKGRLAVVWNEDYDKWELIDELTPEKKKELDEFNYLVTVYLDGYMVNPLTFDDVKSNLHGW